MFFALLEYRTVEFGQINVKKTRELKWLVSTGCFKDREEYRESPKPSNRKS